jgi:hypothetical protein
MVQTDQIQIQTKTLESWINHRTAIISDKATIFSLLVEVDTALVFHKVRSTKKKITQNNPV